MGAVVRAALWTNWFLFLPRIQSPSAMMSGPQNLVALQLKHQRRCVAEVLLRYPHSDTRVTRVLPTRAWVLHYRAEETHVGTGASFRACHGAYDTRPLTEHGAWPFGLINRPASR